MKRLFTPPIIKRSLLTLLLFPAYFSFAQRSERTKDTIQYRHEFGLDATSFVKQFLNLNVNQSQMYSPVYYLTYRYHGQKSNLRIGFGGEFSNKNTKPSSSNSFNREHDITKIFYYRFGYEFIRTINNKWNVFYGLDFRPSVSHFRNDNTNQIFGYSVGTVTDTKIIGFAPLLGVKFQINKRISLSTEVSININYSETRTRNFYTPNSDQHPEKPDDNHRDTYNFFTFFNQPAFIIFAFDL